MQDFWIFWPELPAILLLTLLLKYFFGWFHNEPLLFAIKTYRDLFPYLLNTVLKAFMFNSRLMHYYNSLLFFHEASLFCFWRKKKKKSITTLSETSLTVHFFWFNYKDYHIAHYLLMVIPSFNFKLSLKWLVFDRKGQIPTFFSINCHVFVSTRFVIFLLLKYRVLVLYSLCFFLG
jgi:hypothetical protein